MSVHTKINILFVLVFVLLALVAWQEIRARFYSSTASSGIPAPSYGTTTPQQAFNQADEMKKQLLTSATSSFGDIVTISGKQIVVKTKLIDISKLASLDFTKNPLLPMVDKELTVAITSATAVDLTKLNVGDTVSIVTKESPYSGGTLTAVSISKVGP